MKELLIVTDAYFPSGSAMSSRLLTFCHLFNSIGYKVHVITSKSNNDKNDDSLYTYEVSDSAISYRMQSFFGNNNLIKCVGRYLKNNCVDLVFLTSMNINFLQIYKLVKKYNKKVLLEQCEWFDSSSFRFDKFDPRYIRFIRNIEHNYLKVDGVIAISRFLESYYRGNGVNVIRIPSILDVQNREYSIKTNNNKIRLTYTGNASKSKELLLPIIEAIASDEKYENNFIFDIYGLDEKQLLNNIGGNLNLINKTKNCVFANGYIDQNKIAKILNNTDYQIFIRPKRRSSNAGFPTKLCESLSSGTPVITNATGDIELYIKDEYNGYICENEDYKSVSMVFDKILLDSKNLRRNARKTALDNFDFRIYEEKLERFIETL